MNFYEKFPKSFYEEFSDVIKENWEEGLIITYYNGNMPKHLAVSDQKNLTFISDEQKNESIKNNQVWMVQFKENGYIKAGNHMCAYSLEELIKYAKIQIHD